LVVVSGLGSFLRKQRALFQMRSLFRVRDRLTASSLISATRAQVFAFRKRFAVSRVFNGHWRKTMNRGVSPSRFSRASWWQRSPEIRHRPKEIGGFPLPKPNLRWYSRILPPGGSTLRKFPTDRSKLELFLCQEPICAGIRGFCHLVAAFSGNSTSTEGNWSFSSAKP
jgi:hypothetical protein